MKFFVEEEDVAMTTISRTFTIDRGLNMYEVADYAIESMESFIPERYDDFINEKVVDIIVELEPTDSSLSITIFLMNEEEDNLTPISNSLIEDMMKELDRDIEENLQEED